MKIRPTRAELEVLAISGFPYLRGVYIPECLDAVMAAHGLDAEADRALRRAKQTAPAVSAAKVAARGGRSLRSSDE